MCPIAHERLRRGKGIRRPASKGNEAFSVGCLDLALGRAVTASTVVCDRQTVVCDREGGGGVRRARERPAGEGKSRAANPAGDARASLPPVLRRADDLQRAAGNQAVLALVGGCSPTILREATAVREPPAGGVPDEELLAEGALARARRYYRRRSEHWGGGAVRELRQELVNARVATADQLGSGDELDDATIQAVARFQDFWGMTVDGMVGPETFRMMGGVQTGLADLGAAEEFSEAAAGVRGDWADMSQRERAEELVKAVNERLEAHDVPKVGLGDILDEDDANGSFDDDAWEMDINEQYLGDDVADEAFQNAAEAVYHEARHAEQSFRQARLRAGAGLSSARIQREMGIPSEVADEAVDSPLTPGSSLEAAQAGEWYESFYGRMAAATQRVYREVTRAKRALDRAEAAHERAQERYDRALERYRDLPEEADAFAAQEHVQITEEMLAEEEAEEEPEEVAP